MRARAAIGVDRDGAGRSRLATLRSDPPLTLRPTPAPGAPAGGVGIHLVGTSAGPLAGDDLGLAVTVGPGAALTVRSVAATLVHPAPRRSEPSRLRIDVRVGSDGLLVWAPEPTVLVRGCDHETRVHIELAPGARLVWRDEVVLGRHGEESGSLLARLSVDRVGEGAVLRNDVAVGPRWPGSLGPAGVGPGNRALGTLLLVGDEPAAAEHPGGARPAVLALGSGATLVTAVAPGAAAVTAALDGCTPAAPGAALSRS